MPELLMVLVVGGGIASLTVPLSRRGADVLKECMDIVLGNIALVLLLPVLAICAVIVKLSSKGPVFLAQRRVGKDGVPFQMYKLRTMRPDAEAETGAVWACERDPRVIPACRWMRLSHLDEVPQLINVLKGEMSLVGPRPEREEILSSLAGDYPNVYRRLDVLPGITGLAQIRCGYDTTPKQFRNKLTADVEYIRERDLGLDLRIIMATLPKFIDRQAK